MQHPEEGTIHAWIDGALGPAEAGALEAHVVSCAECSARVAEARGLVAASSRIVSHLDAVPGNVIPAAPAKRRNLWLRSPWPSAIAATLIIGIGIVNSRDRGEPARAITPDQVQVPSMDSLRVAQPERTAQAPAPVTPRTRSIGPAKVATPSAPTADAAPPPAANPARERIADAGSPPAQAQEKKAEARANALVLSEVVVTGTSGAAEPPSRMSAATGSVAGGAAAGGGVAAGAARDLARTQRAGAPSQMARDGFALADVASARAVLAFMGCYAMDASTDVLPSKFALVGDSAAAVPGQLAVRYVDSTGVVTAGIADAGWTTEGGRAIVRTLARGVILTISRSGSEVSAASPSGPRTGRVTSCRQ
jgi:hypothetical protein